MTMKNGNSIDTKVRILEENMEWVKERLHIIDRQVDQLTREVVRATTYIKIGIFLAPFIATFVFWIVDRVLGRGGH